MATKHICSICGKTLAVNALEGLCPDCLLKAGLGSGVDIGPDTEAGAVRPRFVPPTVAELVPLFPQLEILELIGQGGMGQFIRRDKRNSNALWRSRFCRRALAKMPLLPIVSPAKPGLWPGSITPASSRSTSSGRLILSLRVRARNPPCTTF